MSLSFNPTISAVIPAFNERGKLRNILRVVCKLPELNEIIVVDDGSTDDTRLDIEEIQPPDPRIHYLRQEPNQGKVRAMTAGAQAAQSELLLFLDADLYNMTVESIRALIEPVIIGEVDMTIGFFRGGKWATDLSQKINPYLSGQRCIPRQLFFEVPLDQVVGYGIEAAFTIVARQKHWRTRFVPLQGAYHRPSEIRRGSLWSGFRWKMRMFHQIYQTFRAIYPIRRPSAGRIVFLFFLMVFLVTAGLSLVYNRSRASSRVNVASLPSFDFGTAKRVLIIAPHPDDETLGTGGIIQEALAKGLQVRVVVFTNGDAQIPAVFTLQKNIRPTAKDFINDGKIRQQESRNALKILGLPAEDAFYLGYPDRQMQQLWLGDWQRTCPVVGRFTGTTTVPYQDVYRPGAVYCGESVMESLRSILGDYRPDLIFMPHMNDYHPDHRAASQFTLMAVAELNAQDPSYQPETWGYIIHYGSYPPIRGWRQNASLAPPLPLISPGEIWTRLDLTPQEETTKATAIRAYSSQMQLMKSFLEAFARQDEIVERINILNFNHNLPGIMEMDEAAGLDTTDNNSTINEAAAAQIAKNELDGQASDESTSKPTNLPQPGIENTQQLILPGLQLVDLQVAGMNTKLVVTARTRGALLPNIHYLIHFKLQDGSTKICMLGQDAVRLTNTTYACTLDISGLSLPTVVGFNAEAVNHISFDRTGWFFLTIQ